MKTPKLNGRRILVVEDDYMIAQDVRRDLEEAGAIVVGPAPTVDAALRLLDIGSEIHAGVLDVNLGKGKSFPVAEALERRGIPFLFATGYNSADIPVEWRHAKVAMKPLRTAFVVELLTTGKLK